MSSTQAFNEQLSREGPTMVAQVVPYKAPAPALLAALGPTVSVFLSDVETDPWPAGNITALAARCWLPPLQCHRHVRSAVCSLAGWLGDHM